MTLKIKTLVILFSSFLLLSFSLPSSALAFVGSSPACKHTNTPKEFQNCIKQNPIVKDLQIIVNFLSAIAIIAIIGSIIVGGIQYSLAGGSAESVNKAKERLLNSAIAFGVFLLIFAFMQWIIPGGVFG